MIQKIKRSLALRVFVLTFILSLSVSVVTVSFIAWALPVTYVSRLSSALDEQARQLVKILENKTLENCGDIIQNFRQQYKASVAIEYPDGRVVFPGIDMQGEIKNDQALPEDALINMPILSAGGDDAEKRYPFQFTDEAETVTLIIIGETEAVNQITDTLGRILPPLLLLITAISALYAWGYSRFLAGPVIRLNAAARSMAQLDFDGRCDEKRKDEVGQLGKNLNTLSARLSAALQQLQQSNAQLAAELNRNRELELRRLEFFSAASHELKTPVTIIKGQLEGMLQNIGVYKDRDKYLARSFEVAKSMETLVVEILRLSRVESTAFILQKQNFNFSEVVREQLSSYFELIEQNAMDWHVDVPDSMWVEGDRRLLGQGISNLLSNAIQYSPPGACLRIQLTAVPNGVLFAIENTEVHIAEEEIPRLTDAFYRVESSRSRKTGGSGLGLYLTDRILRLHQSELKIANTDDGVCFAFQLPRAANLS